MTPAIDGRMLELQEQNLAASHHDGAVQSRTLSSRVYQCVKSGLHSFTVGTLEQLEQYLVKQLQCSEVRQAVGTLEQLEQYLVKQFQCSEVRFQLVFQVGMTPAIDGRMLELQEQNLAASRHDGAAQSRTLSSRVYQCTLFQESLKCVKNRKNQLI